MQTEDTKQAVSEAQAGVAGKTYEDGLEVAALICAKHALANEMADASEPDDPGSRIKAMTFRYAGQNLRTAEAEIRALKKGKADD